MTLSFSRLACLAVFAVIALVACGGGPGGSVAPTSPPKVIPHVSALAIGKSLEIPLADKFSAPGALTYEATSSDPAVATAAVDGKTLTITAKGAGKAEITVTAADSQDRTASQTFKVTVKPTTSEPEPGAPTVKDGAPTSVDFEAGESTTKIVTLSQVFEGDDLTYSAPESDDTDVAIASISNRVLIIRAGDPGEATITVTATNAKGEAEHEITVTVPPPEDEGEGEEPGDQTPQPSATCKAPPLTFTITINRGRTKQCTIPKNHTLREEAGSGVSVVSVTGDETATLWKVTAKKRGTHAVTIFDGSAKVGTITVVVPNSLPFRNDTSDDPDPMTEAIVLSALPGVTVDLDLASYFSDEDEDATTAVVEEPFRYRIVKPNWVLVDTKDGFVDTNPEKDAPSLTKLRVEVLNKVETGKTFPRFYIRR